MSWNFLLNPELPSSKGASGKIMISPQDGAANFVFRYFRIEPGGHSNAQHLHPMDHGVSDTYGRAIVHLGKEQYEVGTHDIVYISPMEEHTLEAAGEEPLGFLCVIPNKELLKKLEKLGLTRIRVEGLFLLPLIHRVHLAGQVALPGGFFS